MKEPAKKFSDCLKFSGYYLLLLFTFALTLLLLVSFNVVERLAYNPLTFIPLIIVFIAGWNASRKRFSLKQIIIIGMICFLGIIWLIPFTVEPILKEKMLEINAPQQYFILNLLILSVINILIHWIFYIISVLLGGWISSKVSKS